MAKADNKSQATPAALDAFSVQCTANITGEQADAMGALFRSIARLSGDKEVQDLCAHGDLLAKMASNDLDALSETADQVRKVA